MRMRRSRCALQTASRFRRVYNDRYGHVSTLCARDPWKRNIPNPSGCTEQCLTLCMNDPVRIAAPTVRSIPRTNSGRMITDPMYTRCSATSATTLGRPEPASDVSLHAVLPVSAYASASTTIRWTARDPPTQPRANRFTARVHDRGTPRGLAGKRTVGPFLDVRDGLVPFCAPSQGLGRSDVANPAYEVRTRPLTPTPSPVTSPEDPNVTRLRATAGP